MNRPLVSIIIPTYNYSQFIIAALESVSAQSYQNWECIVIDDGSTDDTAAVVKRYMELHTEQNFRYIAIDNAGVSNARNVGISQAKGVYLQFLDADDLLLPNKLTIQVQLLEKENSALVYSNVHYFYQDGHQKNYTQHYPKGFLATSTLSGGALIKALIKNNILPICSPLVHKALVVDAGMFDTGTNHNEDWLLWFKIAMLKPNFVFDQSLQPAAEIRLHQQSGITSRQKMFIGEVFARQYFQKALSVHLLDKNLISTLEKYNQDLLALHQIRSLNLKCGLSDVLKTFAKAPFSNFKLLWMAGIRLMMRTLKGQ